VCRPVSYDDLDAGMSAQPGRQRLSGPPREEIDRTMGLEINEDRGVHLTATEGKIIDAEDPWSWRRSEDGAAQQAQQCHPQAGTRTDGQTHGTSQTRSGLSACRLRQTEEERASVCRATSSGEQRRTEVLGKGAALTVTVVTAEATNGERDLHGARPPGQVKRVAVIAVVHPGAGDAAGRTAPAMDHLMHVQHNRATVKTDQADDDGKEERWGEHGRIPMLLACASVNLLCHLPTTCGRAQFQAP